MEYHSQINLFFPLLRTSPYVSFWQPVCFVLYYTRYCICQTGFWVCIEVADTVQYLHNRLHSPSLVMSIYQENGEIDEERISRQSCWFIFPQAQQIIIILLASLFSWIIKHFEMDGGSLARLEIKGFNKTDKTGVRMFDWKLITTTACLIFSLYWNERWLRGEGTEGETNKGMLVS